MDTPENPVDDALQEFRKVAKDWNAAVAAGIDGGRG